jgi:4'-phosphopantetheinyl transferase EntD
MTTPQTTIHDALTGETVTRDFNAAELAQAKLDKAEAEAQAKTQAEALTAKQAARQAVLDKLGLTADEASALFG